MVDFVIIHGKEGKWMVKQHAEIRLSDDIDYTAKYAAKSTNLNNAQIEQAVKAGWSAALRCYAQQGMSGWSSHYVKYISKAINTVTEDINSD